MRSIQKAGISLVAFSLLLAACGTGDNGKADTASPASSSTAPAKASAGAGEKVSLRMTWWGNQKRADLTMQVIELFERKHPNISIASEFMAQDVYGDKIKTQIAGRSEPDLIVMGNDYIDYAARNVLVDLDEYVGSEIQIDKFQDSFIEPGRMNGKLYGLNLGNNGVGLIYNKTLFDKAGVSAPGTMTWTQLEELGKTLVGKLDKGQYAFADQSSLNEYFELFLRQRGKAINNGGAVGFEAQDVADWLSMWDRFRKEGIIPKAEISSAHTELSAETSTLTEGTTAMVFRYLNQLPAFQDAVKDELGLIKPPSGEDGKTGLWLHPGQYITISVNSEHPKEAAMFANFMINDPEATQILGSDRGISISQEARDALKPTLSPAQLQMFDYFEKVIASEAPMPKAMPAGDWNGALGKAAQKVAFGKSTPEEAGKEVYNAAVKTLK
ncbi:ABC transporter substrate-binding protein [Cohnella sp. GCM10020058]|uniref:ABC transporter substrate-binding protein n=1 Tax=Cohnella sp. GCM10020058 TaxID=3317330 RepID=UPI003630DE6F